MKLTDEAIELIQDVLKTQHKDYVHIGLISHCCGNKQIDMYLIEKGHESHLVDCGILLDMDEEAERFFEGFTLVRDGNALRFVPPEGWVPPAKQGEGCGNHKGEEGRCHHHEGETCECDGDFECHKEA